MTLILVFNWCGSRSALSYNEFTVDLPPPVGGGSSYMRDELKHGGGRVPRHALQSCRSVARRIATALGAPSSVIWLSPLVALGRSAAAERRGTPSHPRTTSRPLDDYDRDGRYAQPPAAVVVRPPVIRPAAVLALIVFVVVEEGSGEDEAGEGCAEDEEGEEGGDDEGVEAEEQLEGVPQGVAKRPQGCAGAGEPLTESAEHAAAVGHPG
ncbi:hypothetical protein B0H11DRAFT_2206100 [Mycena galericulata]|nr:hypothetical protein B0H11DRAFT_2206100 [Mycena galericulata]